MAKIRILRRSRTRLTGRASAFIFWVCDSGLRMDQIAGQWTATLSLPEALAV